MHKQYIKKRGKVYGPYYYESYREGRKVKKRYFGKRGKEERVKNKKENKNKNLGKNKLALCFVLFYVIIFLFLSLVSAKDDPSLKMKITILPSESIEYGTRSTVLGSESNLNDDGCVYKLHRNEVIVPNPDILFLQPGTHSYEYKTAGCENYNPGSVTKNLYIPKAKKEISLYLNDLRSDVSLIGGQDVSIKAEFEESGKNILVFVDNKIVYNGSSPSYNLTFFYKPGKYLVKAYYPGDEYNDEATESFFIFIDMPDSSRPEVKLITPLNNSNVTQSVVFSYNVKDTSSIDNCTLFINGKSLYTSYSVNKSSNNYFRISYLSPGKYSWKVSCADSYGNIGISQSRKFSLLTAIYLGGTEFVSDVSGSFFDVIIIRPPETSGGCVEQWLCSEWSDCINDIRTRECVDLNSCNTDIDKPLIKSTCDFSQPDVDFTPSFFNLTVREAESLDFSVAVEDDFKNSSIVVQWFLDYKLIKQEFGFGSLFSNLNIMAINGSVIIAKISTDLYKEVLIWKIETLDTDCEEKWRCKWSDCKLDRYKYAYDCYDVHNCGTNYNKPYRERCDCTPYFSCSNWSDCLVRYELKDFLALTPVLKGTMKRVCEDIENCVPTKVEEKSCSIEVPTEIRRVDWCNETYVELYSADKLVSRIKQREIFGSKKLDIIFTMSDFRGYCDYCYDNIKNYDEEGVDCGGSCISCEEPRSFNQKIRFNILKFLGILVVVLLISFLIYVVYIRTFSLWIIFKKYKKQNF